MRKRHSGPLSQAKTPVAADAPNESKPCRDKLIPATAAAVDGATASPGEHQTLARHTSLDPRTSAAATLAALCPEYLRGEPHHPGPVAAKCAGGVLPYPELAKHAD
eukprot:CAMPEP_0185569208 /NCGR_PEP_ID=MMETSP0434-20130131/1901_1 /TAXON_ID=626734 ORGANISM="Favella taraikaensis, Strain Fe Narragansett Bay" /NCGR_SAMPLE_ID=MMETSP0434 /ASSEMBLY_ACC=CAM_ASM_000379 /LENGTH=105 /DNA_ID=CAMNT_0028183919 /DNA_START=1403 /DNA_END=1721 /DNA_ORIENTATION=-